MFREYLARRPYPTSYSQNTVVSICPNSLHFSHVQRTCIISWDAQSRATHKISSVFNLLESSHSLSHTQHLQLNSTINTGYKRLNKIIIKFGTKLKPTKQIVVNYNFTFTIKEQKKSCVIGEFKTKLFVTIINWYNYWLTVASC